MSQILSRAVVSAEVMDIFKAAGLDRPDVGILPDEFLEDVRKLKEKNLAVEMLLRRLNGQIKSRFGIEGYFWSNNVANATAAQTSLSRLL